MKHIVMFSGGVGSWMTAKRVSERYGVENVVLLFADTRIEDEDLYRFLRDAAANVGAPLVHVADGRDPWKVFHDVKWLGNARIAQCSHLLKQKPCRKWLEANCDAASTVVHVGIDWTEVNRLPAIVEGWKPYGVEALLTVAPLLSKTQIIAALKAEGIVPPRLYGMGFPHNNCGGFCVRAGHAQFKRLLETMPERYAHHEREEERLRKALGKDVAILRDRAGGDTKPLTLKDFRERNQEVDQTDWAGCACFA